MKDATVITIRGNLTEDPQPKTQGNGAKLRVAVTDSYFDRESQTWKDLRSEFYTVFTGPALGANVLSSVRKGNPVVVTGRLSTNTWQDDAGTDRTDLQINADSVAVDLVWGSATYKGRLRLDTIPEHDPSTGEVLTPGEEEVTIPEEAVAVA
ncbi:single-stranded DNA-binding protein [Brachybacterium sp. SGAir0954]|uniref:single-stranded DNA-binding protein n=1 Tax=Brachybacterium sp. SGAir0954 TaxID=2571029 RepID=UPI0010CD525A|nr:single-stranded DNA-binding protein [Brachybacterium sp. SGAir0954]QCR53712.1 single-stranded DNA-binding protein [Brachybacterium sp. SGAir0954]